MRAAAGNMKKISLELGGKSPNIVFADADFETAVDYALFGIYANAGQVCSAGSRLLLEDAIHDKFVARLVERAERSSSATASIRRRRWGRSSPSASATGSRSTSASASTRARSSRPAANAPPRANPNGYFIEPTIFVDTKPEMRIVREEIFGPVLAVQRFSGEAEAIRLANDTDYGLAAAVFATDGARAQRVIRKLRAGITWVNTYHPTYNEAPWGGYKQSGIGRELGTYGYEAYTEVKQININLAVEPSGWFADPPA